MHRYFGPEGLLSRQVERYEFRVSQQELAQAVTDALDEGRPLVVEAGTGTGKTWGYLIPAILSGRRVVVSTGTKTLQDQILDQDIPFLRRTVAPALKAVCLKGRRNYLCRRRFREFSYQPTLFNRDEAKLLRRFQVWAASSKTGDRTEVGWLPDRFLTWNEVCSSTEHCLGQACEDHSRCHLTRIRGEAARANVIVVNHHLFFADLALRDRKLKEVLPDYDAVIFDEAHQIEDTVGSYFGPRYGSIGFLELSRDILREMSGEQKKNKNYDEIIRIARQLEVLARLLQQRLAVPGAPAGRFPLDLGKVGGAFVETSNQAMDAMERLGALLQVSTGDAQPTMEGLSRRVLETAEAVRATVGQKDDSLVYWYEVTQNGVFVQGTPIDVAPILREKLYSKTPTVIMTSATLSIAGSFDYLKGTLGLPANTGELHLASPFSFERQAMLYIPSRFPAPQEPEFCPRMAEDVLKILTKTRGRALLLFTSFRNMREVRKLVGDQLPYPILVQGDKPKRMLLAEFREKIDSVLFATSSFWQGIDVPGEALSCLLIDKLPFEVPDDPLIAARMDHLAKRGGNPFFQYQVPRAVIQLKQGVGRLIRTACDRGVIGIFDIRLVTKGYGKIFINSLPPCCKTNDIEVLGEFIDKIEPSGECLQEPPVVKKVVRRARTVRNRGGTD